MKVNYRTRELQVKIVYYGPAMAGKTTNIQQIFQQVAPERRSDLTVLDTDGDRTLFFDYFQVELGTIGGFTPRINLYTVPGQAIYATTRKIVLRGADAVVFVADSAPERSEENRASWEQLHEHLEALGLAGRVPIVVQWNKRDLPSAMAVEKMKALLGLNDHLASFEAIAIKNQGVRETFEAALQQIFHRGKSTPKGKQNVRDYP